MGDSTNDTQSPRLELVAPSSAYREDFLAMAAEYAVAGTDNEKVKFAEAARDFDAYLRQCRDRALGLSLAEGQVPFDVYWLVADGRTIVANSTLRHHLTPPLQIEGGHIGYGTRPSQRRKGYGRAICALTLQKARRRGLKRVLITCNTQNTASARIIVANGGKFAGEDVSPRTGLAVSRYWVDL
jgi:predicted acetyltransferase